MFPDLCRGRLWVSVRSFSPRLWGFGVCGKSDVQAAPSFLPDCSPPTLHTTHTRVLHHLPAAASLRPPAGCVSLHRETYCPTCHAAKVHVHMRVCVWGGGTPSYLPIQTDLAMPSCERNRNKTHVASALALAVSKRQIKAPTPALKTIVSAVKRFICIFKQYSNERSEMRFKFQVASEHHWSSTTKSLPNLC